ncbi:MAG: sensor histidine kinase [Cyclobacteriaceae bacterium]
MWKNGLSIRFWIVLLINTLIIFTVVILSIFFYQEFQQTLNQRVLLQLTSIKRLKRVQVEEHFTEQWKDFVQYTDQLMVHPGGPYPPDSTFYVTDQVDTLDFMQFIQKEPPYDGIYDITGYSEDGRMMLAYFMPSEEGLYIIKTDKPAGIQAILMERTGMGESGETYLVGSDFKMRSESRFLSNTPPYSILARTPAVERALAGDDGSDIIKDYREVEVYSAYHKLDISGPDWAIVSEIDVSEAMAPLEAMRVKLVWISITVMLMAIALSFFMAEVVSKPVLKMRRLLNSMSKGEYAINVKASSPAREMNEMFKALGDLKNSINGAIGFSHEIGKMNLDASYQLSGKNDTLGKSLVVMREKLIEFNKLAESNRLASKQSLITGQENERKRLSRELHDGLGPLLTGLKLTVQSAEMDPEKKSQVKKLIDETIDEIRRMTYNIMPQSLIDFGVGKALINLVNLVKKAGISDISFDNSLKEDQSKIGSDLNICLFRVTQELINNTLKHSGATKIRMSLTEFDDKICLYYSDNGCGFDIKTVKLGSGLRNLKERIEVFNGYLSIVSQASGTEVEVEIPLVYE